MFKLQPRWGYAVEGASVLISVFSYLHARFSVLLCVDVESVPCYSKNAGSPVHFNTSSLFRLKQSKTTGLQRQKMQWSELESIFSETKPNFTLLWPISCSADQTSMKEYKASLSICKICWTNLCWLLRRLIWSITALVLTKQIYLSYGPLWKIALWTSINDGC